MTYQIPWAQPCLRGNEREFLADAIESSWISGGPYVDRFEAELVSRLGGRSAVSTSNGTTALHLALLGLGIGTNDEVIVPGYSFVAPVNMVIAVGARPIYADILPETWCLDPESVESKIGARTRAVIPVHTYGNVCDLETLASLAGENGLHVVEDAAEAAFSEFSGRAAGTWGDAGCFSFHATKTITTGEGGAVLTGNTELYHRMGRIRDHGMRKGKRYWHDEIGYNFRMTNLQAALGCAQLEHVEQIIEQRKIVYSRYRERLGEIEGISMQCFREPVKPVVWAIAVKLDPRAFGDRDEVMAQLGAKGIETRPGFHTFGDMPLYDAPKLPVSQDVSHNVLALPSSPSLTLEEVNFVCDEFLRLKK